MCFSATASFIAAAAFAGAGAASIRKAKRPQELYFASIPLLFASQQVIEGMLWLIIGKSAYAEMQGDLTYVYLFIAEVLWPVWVPLSLLLMEKKGWRRTLLYLLLLLGVAVAAYLCFRLLTFGAQSDVVDGHIRYLERHLPAYRTWGTAPYLLVTIAPFLVSGVRFTSLVGMAVIAAYLLARLLFFEQFLTSIGCFYAAVVSPLVVFAMYAPSLRKTILTIKK